MLRTVVPLLCLQAASALTGIVVRDNAFVDIGTNETVVLRGVSHSSGEYRCVQTKDKTFEAPITDAFVNGIKSWGNNVVRIPLNEDCWIGLNGASPAGSAYQTDVKKMVKLLTDAGVAVLLDLHWAAHDTMVADKQAAMPDKSHSVDFWTSVASTFKGNPLALFELYNEPFPDSGNVSNDTWKCLRTGACDGRKGVDYDAAGLQDLIAAVRSTGATNVVLASGLTWTNDLDGWLSYRPDDPAQQLGAVWHSYDFNACSQQSCWDSTIASVAKEFPVIVTESGFKIDYVQKLWPWCEQQGVSYMAWTWNNWKGEGLVTDWDGTPSQSWGEAWKIQLAQVSAL